MKKEYERPNIEIEKVEYEDVILESGLFTFNTNCGFDEDDTEEYGG